MAEGRGVGGAQASRALQPVDDVEQLGAGHVRAGGDHEGLHAGVAVEHDGLRVLAVLRDVGGGGVIRLAVLRAVIRLRDERL